VLQSVLTDEPEQACVEKVIDMQLMESSIDCFALINGAWYVAITYTLYVERGSIINLYSHQHSRPDAFLSQSWQP
jgi:hypothetical protein